MKRYPTIDLARVRTISIRKRRSKVRIDEFAKPFGPHGGSFRAFTNTLPHILVANDLRSFVGDVVSARRRDREVIALIGAHVIKVGLAPLIIDLVRRKVLTCIAMNSAAAIHDVETAMWGRTSEDVEENLLDGTFGMARETGEFVNGVLRRAMDDGDAGYGEALGTALRRAPHRALSVLAACKRLGVPVTVHAAIGTDIVHQQPSMDGAATGELSFRDFRLLCGVVARLNRGVVMNIGSAVILPEIFLKALTVARNLGYPSRNFSTANFDMQQHYRPRMNIVQRPTAGGGGKGYLFTGHHEIMIPLVAAMINDRLRGR
jgi:hypothetical protein